MLQPTLLTIELSSQISKKMKKISCSERPCIYVIYCSKKKPYIVEISIGIYCLNHKNKNKPIKGLFPLKIFTRGISTSL